jgi:hypothetical protein
MCARNENSIALQKPIKHPRFLSYGREITIALLVKFMLLGCLWWLFFKGHKLPVDGDVIAAKLFGENPTVIQLQKSPENPK